jgi:hypothetical protein
VNTRRIISLTALAYSVVLSAASAMATPISGSISGGGFGTVSFTNLNLCPTGSTPNGGNQGDACVFGVGNQTLGGGSLSLSSFTSDSIQSLNSTLEPIGATVSLADWLVFSPASGLSLTLTEVLPGTFTTAECGATPAPGQTCTPPNSSFDLSNADISDSTATFVIIGNAVDGNPADTSPFRAVFTAQFSVPYQELLSALAANGNTGNYSSSYSETINITPSGVPEPATFLLIGVGMTAIGILGRRRTANDSSGKQ